MKKYNRLQLIICILLFVFCVSFLMGCVPKNQNIDFADVNGTFEEDLDDLQCIVEYLYEYEYDYIIIGLTGFMTVDGGERIPIANADIEETVKSLYNKGYLRLAKDCNTIKFHRWDKVLDMEFQAGFAYVADGSEKLDISFVVYQEPLTNSNWYYYEADYNEYRETH